MITKKEAVRDILAATGIAVRHQHPGSWSQTPLITWHEKRNRCIGRADGQEYLCEMVYEINVWTESAAESQRIAALVDLGMTGAGFRRLDSEDEFEAGTRYCRSNLKYRCVADAAGSIYQ